MKQALTAGIQLSSVKPCTQNEADLRRTLLRLRAIGYKTAQLQWHALSIPAAAVSDALGEAGMRAVSLQEYTHVVMADPAPYLALAAACRLEDVCVSGIPAEYMTPAGIARFAAWIAPLGERAAALGCTLSFHPRWQELAEMEGKIVLTRLLEAAGPSLRVVLDFNHVIRAGLDGPAFLRALSGRVDFIHCKDMTDAARERSHLVPVGAGCVDWPPILAAARETGVRVAFAEQESWDGDAFAAMSQSWAYLTATGCRS